MAVDTTASIKSVSLSEHVVTVAEEHVLSIREIVDVALPYAAGDVVMVIKVYVTHLSHCCPQDMLLPRACCHLCSATQRSRTGPPHWCSKP